MQLLITQIGRSKQKHFVSPAVFAYVVRIYFYMKNAILETISNLFINYMANLNIDMTMIASESFDVTYNRINL